MVEADVLVDRLASAFPEVSGRRVRIARAPGRVNLIGEHTDYNDGLVLPASIDMDTVIVSAASDDRRVELELEDGSRAGFDLDGIPPAQRSWIDTVAGMAWSVLGSGVPLRGLRGVVATDIPIGSGLSSSAAFQLAAAWSMASALPPMQPMELALAGQRAENQYVGVRSGVMDQFASAHGRTDAALLLDCRSLEFREVRLPLDRYALVVCDTRSPRRLESSEYNERRAQCEQAVAVLSDRLGRKLRSLRDVDEDMLNRFGADLDDVARRRATHVVLENARVTATVDALERGAIAELGPLWAESHHSLRELYEVTSPELDALVEIAAGMPGVVAARMTGAGFGGCTVNLVERDAVRAVTERISAEYRAVTGEEPGVYPVEPAPGAGVVERT